jgi:hypothetical protein
LSARQLDAHAVRRPLQDPKSSAIDPAHTAAISGDLSFIFQVDPAMVGERPRGQFSARDDRRVDRPGLQFVAVLEHEIPVHSIPVVFEYDKTRHSGLREIVARTAHDPRASFQVPDSQIQYPDQSTNIKAVPGQPKNRDQGWDASDLS